MTINGVPSESADGRYTRELENVIRKMEQRIERLESQVAYLKKNHR